MYNFSQGDIVYVPFPFTEKPSEVKDRTALIISKNEANSDKVILAYVTSVVKNQKFAILTPFLRFL